MTRGALALALALGASPTHAQSAAVPLAGADGRPGVWLELALARDALGCLDAREPNERRIRLLDAELSLRVQNEISITAERDNATREALRVAPLRRRVRRLVWVATGLSAGFALALAAAFATGT